ncbi:WD repeat-containing protein 64-like isoform X2 [Pomacea canaliculata]|uniref:WD repeat-containing protein 64-like isoform X2 n=1 Tax=Pomacea canaliculata TaxID=400727 RepID=UPI000D73A9AF|nr:WD repeat-containing protein 64-like isoform X2 [Pomacea canaliculata]
MEAARELTGDDPQRPYTMGTFESKLNRFQELIRDLTYQDVEATPEERRQWITENLRYEQFCEKIRELFGSDIKNQDLKSVYRKISTNPDAKVDWSELFGYFQSGVEEEDMTVGEEVSVFMVSKRRRVGEAAGDRKRRDSVQTLKFVPLLDSYLAASQKGAITVWSSKLRLQACVDLNEPAWVTGCDFLPNLRRVACCTERSLAVWDNRAKGNSQSVFILKPIEHSPQCMTYMPGPQFSDEHEDTILFGDDQGYINVLNLVAKDLTMKNSKGEGRNSFNMTIEPSKLTHPIVRRKIHGDWVLKVKYFPDLRCFASCSPSSHVSFVLEEPERLYDNGEVRGVSVPKGVNCFDYCVRANIIATGGVDKIIRVWHPHIFSRPTGKLMGHLFTVIDIVCNERDQHIISLSTARVFRVWDIHTLTCLQVFTDNEERPGEKRIYSMLFDNKNERLLTGSSVIDAWPLTRAVQDTMQVPHTHDRPLVQILTNKDLNQIVSVCTESVIKVWEMDTGKLVYSISEAHGPNVEVTALALDNSGYRLASGAFDGSLKVWDFGAGQCIKCKAGRSTDEDLSITGLVYQRFYDDHVIVASGWTNKIKLVLDSKDNTDLTILREFNDVYFWTREVSITSTSSSSSSMASAILPDIGQPSSPVTSVFRKDFLLTNHEVTCMTAITSDVMATGCGNGNIIFWNVERAVVEKIFLLPPSQNSSARSRHRMRQAGERRVNCMRVLVHRVRRLDPAYIKKLTGNYRSGTEETKEDDNKSQETGRRSKRSVVAIGQGPDGQLDEDSKRLLRELSSSLGGKEQQAQDIVQDSAVQTRSESQGEDKIQQEASNTNTEEKPDTKDGEKTDVKTEAHDDGTGAWGLDSGDPDAKMIVDIFDPILVTVHHDAFVRFWDLETGKTLREISPMTRRQGVPVTAICHDADVNFLVTGDNKGYLTLWDVKAFMENPTSKEKETLRQVVSWRAHLTRVVSLEYVDSMKAIFSASTDGSVRVWWGTKGRFVGFFGQHRSFHFPATDETAGTPSLPYDITEGPLAPIKRKGTSQKITASQNFEYPLIFDQQRWQPFRRSAYMAKKHEVLRPEDKKFFGALIKPRAYNDHLESFTTGEKTSGAVFRALPVYRIKTPKKPKTPDVSLKQNNEEEKNMFGPSSIFGITQAIKAPATKITGRRSHHTRLPVLAASASALNGTGLTLSPVSRPR